MSAIVETAVAAIQQNPAMRWLKAFLCLPLCGAGLLGLLFPQEYRSSLLKFFSRAANQENLAPFMKLVNYRHFILLVRLLSILPIGVAIAIFRSLL